MQAPLDCTLCPRLCASRKAVVNGSGKVDADIMIVSNFPDAKSEQYGEPLHIKSWTGKKLRTKLMPLAGINPDEVWYEYLARCRTSRTKTGGDSPVSASEIKTCGSFLREAIIQVAPKLIIPLGAQAVRWFFPDAKLDEVHGQLMEWEGIKVVPMYDPTIVKPHIKPKLAVTLNDDWKKLGVYFKGEKRSQTEQKLGEYKLVSGKLLARLIRKAGVTRFAFDYETTDPMFKGTFQARRARPIGFSVAWEEGKAYYCTDSIDSIREFLESPEIEVIAHNAKFEWIVSKNCGINLINTHDTKLLAYLLRKPKTNLKDLAWNELGIKQTRFEEVDWNDIDQVTQYGAADSDVTLRLFNRLYPELETEGLRNVYENVERPLIPVLGQMELNGVLVDDVPFIQLEAQLRQRLQEIDEELKVLYPHDINWRSVPQKQNALFGPRDGGYWDTQPATRSLTYKEWSKKERQSDEEIQINYTKLVKWIPPGLGITQRFGNDTDIPTLHKIEMSDESHPIIPLLIERNTIARALSGEVVKLPELRQEDGRVHSSFHQSGGWEELGGDTKEATDTGRLSSSGPNLHNITNHGDTSRPYVAEWGRQIRKGIVAPPGWKIVKADLGQEEPRIGAYLSGDSELAAAIESGDMYLENAAMAYNKSSRDIDKEERQIGKRMFMAYLNRAGPNGIGKSAFWLTTPERRAVLKYMGERFWKFEQWCDEEIRKLHEVGFVTTHFGRKVTFPEVWTGDPRTIAKAERACIPGIIQGTAADVLKILLDRIDKQLYTIEGKLVLNVHDEIVLEVLDKYVDDAVELVSHMTDGIMPIHLPVEVAVGRSWGEAELVRST